MSTHTAWTSLFQQTSDMPETIGYHYTSCAGIKGIIESSSLRAVCMAYMNDTTEIIHGRKMFSDVVNSMPALFKGDKDYEGGNIPAILNALGAAAETATPFNSYGCCFSGAPGRDLLSQWRGYGSNGHGYSIAFRLNKLVDQLSDAYGFFVEYDTGPDANSARYILKEILKIMKAHLQRGTPNLGERYFQDLCELIIPKFIPMFKDGTFREEHEFRIMVAPEWIQRNLSKIKTFPRDTYLVPYAEIKPRSNFKLPIVDITVGPCHDFERAKHSLRLMLDNNGYRDVKICRSELTYRS